MTFLRWAGSKKQLLETLACCWYASQAGRPRPGRYVEGFSGSAALFFRLAPAKALLVDVNGALQECMQTVREEPKQVSQMLRRFRSSEKAYYKVRALDEARLSPAERAARLIYLNRFCFNGLYRTNAIGKFNVPYGKSSKSGRLPTATDLLAASACLRRAQILTGDFVETLTPRIAAGDFIYLDPPYARENERIRNQYGPSVFGTEDINRLRQFAKLADSKGATFLISYAACEEIQDVASDWSCHEVTVQRTIAANVDHRRAVKELLITNLGR